MFKNMKLSTKLISGFLLVGIIPACIVGLISLSKASNALETQSYNQLISMRDVKKNQIEDFVANRENDMKVLVENIGCLRQEAFSKLGAVQTLKKNEISEMFDRIQNDVVCGSMSKECKDFFALLKEYHDNSGVTEESSLDVTTEEYHKVWAQVDQYWKRYVKDYGYYDVFMICAKHGHVLYTNCKESDLGTNLRYGPQKNEGLARLWKKVLDTKDVAIEDFSSYSPSNGDFAAFMGAPVLDDSGNVISVFALQLPTDSINKIAQTREGMGISGETYLVGKHNDRTSFRSDMLTMGNGDYVVGYEIHTSYIDKILSGVKHKIEQVFTDSKGKLVMVAADTLELNGLQWGIVSKIDFEEAIALKLESKEEDFLTTYNNLYGYYDLFLINPDGYCFYTVCHEADYQTNFVNGKYSDSNMGQLVRDVIQSQKFGFADFAPYAPRNGNPACFVAQPVVNNGNVELVVGLQLSLDSINGIMQQRDGMGQTGECYLVGQDKRMRSDSILDSENHSVMASFAGTVQKNGCDTEAVHNALAGKTEAKIITDYNGNPVLNAYTPVTIGDTTWALIAEIDESEAFAAKKAIIGLMIIVLSISVASIAVLAWLITRSIANPIKKIINGLTEGSEQVAAASGQVSSASQSLAEGATEQAAGLEETSSSLEEMSAMTKQNADNAQQANTLASEARRAADTGTESMTRMNQAIQDIQKSSDETAKIIKVIDEIAFQTNLLALNAAVEAARAGEAGKGFAVVAEEVRNLAMRSAEAAKNTANLIEESVKNSKNGVDIATEVGKVLEEIVSSISKTTDLVSEIAAASSEQAQGIDQVNTAVSQMDKVTQQNAANAEESASASEELSAQAEHMDSIVRDLALLIGGVDNRIKSGKSKSNTAKNSKTMKSNQEFNISNHVFHDIAQGKTKKTGSQKSVYKEAQKMIPLDDNEIDSSDFDEFNA